MFNTVYNNSGQFITLISNKKDINCYAKINAFNINKINLSITDALARISNFVINIIENKKITETESALLVAIKFKLDANIEKINNDTTGIYNFFRYLFSPSLKAQKRHQIEGMQALRKLIDDIKVVQNKPFSEEKVRLIESKAEEYRLAKAEETSQPIVRSQTPDRPVVSSSKVETPIQVRTEAKIESKKEEVEIPQSSAMDVPARIIASSSKVENPIQVIAEAKIESKKEEVEIPQPSATDVPARIIASSSKVEDLIQVINEDKIESKKEEVKIPQPPPMNIPLPPAMKGPPPPGAAKKVLSFNKEPKEPIINLKNVVSKLGIKKLEEEIEEIKKFLEEMKAALEPIEKAINRELELEKSIKERKGMKIPLENAIKAENKKINLLQNNDPIVNLKLQVKKDEIIEISFFSEEKFREINNILAKEELATLPLKFLKSNALNAFIKKLSKLEKAKQDNEDTIPKEEKELEEIRKSQNQGILFKNFATVLAKKQLIVSKWTAVLNLRNKRLEELKPNGKENEKKVDDTPARQAKPSSKNILENLKKQYPELENIIQLKESQNAQILLKGKDKDFYANLVI